MRNGIVAWLALMGLAAGASAATRLRPPIVSISHLAVYAADMAKSEAFYTHDLGAVRMPDPEDPAGVRYYFSPTQFVEVLPLPAGEGGINRMAHAALNTTDAVAMRAYLQAKGIVVPAKVEEGADGSRWFDVMDPEGTPIQFVQPPARLPAVPVDPLSGHIMHIGFIVHDRARADGFYRTVLGFRPYWAGGMKDGKTDWVSQQVPDGRDWLEYMIVGTPEAKGIPTGMSQPTLGILNHFSLGVANMEAAYTALWKGNRLKDQNGAPQIGRDAKWQLNLIDPDGTRAEIMELHAIGKPCCSPFAGPDPQR